jgi:hypothetical protein
MVGTPPSRNDDIPRVEPNGHWERGITNVVQTHGDKWKPHTHEEISELEMHRIHKPRVTGGMHPDHDNSAVYEEKSVAELFKELRGHTVID